MIELESIAFLPVQNILLYGFLFLFGILTSALDFFALIHPLCGI